MRIFIFNLIKYILMKMLRVILLFFSFCILFSCKDSQEMARLDTYQLKPTGIVKKFVLDTDVRYNCFYLYLFKDEVGREYLSFLNYRTNQIYFYDWETAACILKLELDAEGPDGVVLCSGYYVKDFDNIYVTNYAYPGLIRVDTMAHIVQKIPYGTTQDGYEILQSYAPSSFAYNAPVIMGDSIYIIQPPLQFVSMEQTPLSILIDTARHSSVSLPLTYEILSEKEKETNYFGTYSRIFDGKNFIYSFRVKEDIIIASLDHRVIKQVKVKSRYMGDVTGVQKDTEWGPKQNLELARYGDLIYDPYREVYYRFAYPKVSLEKDMNWWGKSIFGCKKFSVIILNKDFQIIGETLFPESIYNSYVFFVREDGLYISRDYQMLYGNQSDDYMTFERVELVKK